MIFSIGSRKSEGSIAAGVYDILRRMDAIGAEYIYTESFEQDHLGQAIMNRMIKAAGYQRLKFKDRSVWTDRLKTDENLSTKSKCKHR